MDIRKTLKMVQKRIEMELKKFNFKEVEGEAAVTSISFRFKCKGKLGKKNIREKIY